MSENQFQYGTGYTSTKIHHAPGGKSNFSLGWDEDEQVKPKPQASQNSVMTPTPEVEAPEPEIAGRASNEESKKEEEVEGTHTSIRIRQPPGGSSSITFG